MAGEQTSGLEKLLRSATVVATMKGMMYADEIAKFAQVGRAFCLAVGGLTEVRDIANAWDALEEQDILERQAAHEHDLRAASPIYDRHDSYGNWHAGFDIDSDGHWIPMDLEETVWNPARAAHQSGDFSDWSDDS